MGQEYQRGGHGPQCQAVAATSSAVRPHGTKVTRIFVRDLTPETEGNAIGVASPNTLPPAGEEDRSRCPPPSTASRHGPEVGRILFLLERTVTPLQAAFDNSGVLDAKELRLAWIKNTLGLEYLWASEPMLAEAKANPRVEIISELQEIPSKRSRQLMMPVAPALGGLTDF